MREAKVLDKLAIEAELRTLPSESELEPTDLKKRNHLRLRSALVEADVMFYERKMELAGIHMSRCERRPQEVNEGVAAVQLAEARLRKAWWDAEAAFSDLVLAFPQEKGMERPAFPTG